MFCLRVPKGDMAGCFLMNSNGSCPIFEADLDTIKDLYSEFWGFEIVEIDSLENRNIIGTHGIIPKPTNFEEN